VQELKKWPSVTRASQVTKAGLAAECASSAQTTPAHQNSCCQCNRCQAGSCSTFDPPLFVPGTGTYNTAYCHASSAAAAALGCNSMSRRVRPPRGGGAYIPPHLRNGAAAALAAAAAESAPGRSLDELAPHNMHIRLVYTNGGPFSLDGCPDNITEQPAGQEEQQQQQQQRPTDTEGELAGCSKTAVLLQVTAHMQVNPQSKLCSASMNQLQQKFLLNSAPFSPQHTCHRKCCS
jgi:hypothetical protein